MRRAQLGGSLAEVGFAGEFTSNPLGGIQQEKSLYISGFWNNDLAMLDSLAKSSKSSLPNPLGQIQLAKSRLLDWFSVAETVHDWHCSADGLVGPLLGTSRSGMAGARGSTHGFDGLHPKATFP